jgi:hypothetical protein
VVVLAVLAVDACVGEGGPDGQVEVNLVARPVGMMLLVVMSASWQRVRSPSLSGRRGALGRGWPSGRVKAKVAFSAPHRAGCRRGRAASR